MVHGMRLKGLLEPFENSVEFESIITDINNEKYPMGIYGVSESGRIYIVDNIFENIKDPSLLVLLQNHIHHAVFRQKQPQHPYLNNQQ